MWILTAKVDSILQSGMPLQFGGFGGFLHPSEREDHRNWEQLYDYICMIVNSFLSLILRLTTTISVNIMIFNQYESIMYNSYIPSGFRAYSGGDWIVGQVSDVQVSKPQISVPHSLIFIVHIFFSSGWGHPISTSA
jgi:hypothetical protein